MKKSSLHPPLLYPPRKLGENLVKVAKQVDYNQEGTAQFLSFAVDNLEDFPPERGRKNPRSSKPIDNE